MAFLVKYTTGTGTTVLSLHPRPTSVSYPERRTFKKKDTKDGAVVLARPLRDSRPRQWIWKGYRQWITGYAALWETFKTLDTKARVEASLSPTVQIWEDETGPDSGFGLTTGGAPDLVAYANLIWTTVRIIQVTREMRDNGGPLTFEKSIVEFTVEDDSFSTF